MKDKLELKDIACYLPYGLKCRLNRTGIFNLDEEYPQPHNEVCEITNLLKANNGWEVEISDEGMDYSCGMIGLDEIEILLRPMSDLVKPLPDGTIPIVELAKIVFDVTECNPLTTSAAGVYDCRFSDKLFLFNVLGFHFSAYAENGNGTWRQITCPNQYQLFAHLFENHYDVFGLIDKGLAIDINKIENENT